MKPRVTPDPPPDGRPWTTVAPGDTTIIVKNRTTKRVVCALSGSTEAAEVSRHGGSVLRTKLTAAGAPHMPGYSVLRCTGEGMTQAFDFWTAT